MSESESRRKVKRTFSLLHLLILTTWIAIVAAVGLAYQKNRSLLRQRDELHAISGRLELVGEDELASAAMPRVANDFHSWQVHVPAGTSYEVRLGLGAISEDEFPPIVGSVPIAAGKHRVTLRAADSPADEFRYVVYVDGKQAIEKTMGRDWIPGGWSSASGMNWPSRPGLFPAPLELGSQGYKPNLDFGSGNYFNGQSDRYVTRNGYRLWIDPADRTWKAASPFMGFASGKYQGVGLRDGLRYQSPNGSPYHWTFTRPQLETNEPVLRIAAEFFMADSTSLSSQTKSFTAWQLRRDAGGENEPDRQIDPARSAHTVVLQAQLNDAAAPQVTMEVKWDTSRPDAVGLRIADTPTNQGIKRWRLRILDGTHHLWRQLLLDGRTISADEIASASETEGSDATVALDLRNSEMSDIRLRWRTDETLPLQVLARQQKIYAGLDLYEGLPVAFGIQIPASLNPTLEVKIAEENPTVPADTFPGGTVVDEIQIDLDASRHDWVWLEASLRAAQWDSDE